MDELLRHQSTIPSSQTEIQKLKTKDVRNRFKVNQVSKWQNRVAECKKPNIFLVWKEQEEKEKQIGGGVRKMGRSGEVFFECI